MFWLQLVAMVSRNFPQYRVNSEGNTFKLHSLRVLLRYKTSNGWKFVAPLLKARYDAGAVAFNGKIYIMGGNWYNGYLKSVECYNTDSNSWSKCADMRYNHVKPALYTMVTSMFLALIMVPPTGVLLNVTILSGTHGLRFAV
uniref:Kelch-like protein 22 n=1 Tax=Zeugodacus cucurbitae TaxID=28588 RepID=A0A0A1XSD0_ZEUCU